MAHDVGTPPAERCISFFRYIVLDYLIDCDCWVAGGAVRDFFAGRKVSSDVDIFFRNRDAYEFAKARMTSDKELPIIFSSEQTLVTVRNKHKIQLVGSHFFDSPAMTISEFDFTVCSAAVDAERVYMHETFLMDLAGRHLVINKLTYPLSTLQRLQKYILKGFTACNGTFLDLARALQTVDLQNASENTFLFYPDGTPKFIRLD